ncbi:GM20428 [Drosophila sechellia]|uniref:GM20428 n=1 Tax=Drosophila sechellia TaxID=7238 RepID=B4IMH2_DROSE|nr:GM20428 [Drosophila sechellia]
MGAILDDFLMKVNHNGVRSNNLAMKNSFARLKELQLKLRTRLPEAEKSQVGRTAEQMLVTKNRATVKQPPGPRKKRPPRERPDALVITPSAGLPYSELLSMVTRGQDARLRAIGENVTRVKKTAKGELLLALRASAQDLTQKLKMDMGAVLGDRASLRALTQSKVFVIRDLDELTTEDELKSALEAQAEIPAAVILASPLVSRSPSPESVEDPEEIPDVELEDDQPMTETEGAAEVITSESEEDDDGGETVTPEVSPDEDETARMAYRSVRRATQGQGRISLGVAPPTEDPVDMLTPPRPTPAQAPLLTPPRPTRMPSTPPPQPRTPTPPP